MVDGELEMFHVKLAILEQYATLVISIILEEMVTFYLKRTSVYSAENLNIHA